VQRRLGALLAGLLAILSGFASAREARGESRIPAAAKPSVEARLSGQDIYERVLANRFRSFAQDSVLRSGDRAGREQVTKLRMEWQDFRDDNAEPRKGVLSKTLVRYSHPFDIRHSGYLIVHNDDRPNDQFVYFPSRRRVVRVNLRSEAVFGTDFSFEDILPRELRDATYRRLENGTFEGIPTFTIAATPTELADSEYSRFEIQVDRERYVTLHTRYWDSAGVEVKRMQVDPESIVRLDGVWVAKRITMSNLRLESSTTLEVAELEPNPELPRGTFTLRRLETH
jgi:hypothetical protein